MQSNIGSVLEINYVLAKKKKKKSFSAFSKDSETSFSNHVKSLQPKIGANEIMQTNKKLPNLEIGLVTNSHFALFHNETQLKLSKLF